MHTFCGGQRREVLRARHLRRLVPRTLAAASLPFKHVRVGVLELGEKVCRQTGSTPPRGEAAFDEQASAQKA